MSAVRHTARIFALCLTITIAGISPGAEAHTVPQDSQGHMSVTPPERTDRHPAPVSTRGLLALDVPASDRPAPDGQGLHGDRASCLRRCDLDYVRTHQACIAVIGGLAERPDAAGGMQTPLVGAADCDRAARSGIRQCQTDCTAGPLSRLDGRETE
ncbi:MAG: hypothetical protein AAF311_14585 [Pseudomonadota bacterium]